MRELKIQQSITVREAQSLEQYLREISPIKGITVEEEVVLAQKIRQGDEKALEKLIRANLRFVVSVAKQYQSNGLSLNELINEGNIGLIKAAGIFDETRGFKFISFAVWWIRQSILQALADKSRLVRLPLNKVIILGKIKRITSSFEQGYLREPTVAELAELLEVPSKQILDAMKSSVKQISFDAPAFFNSDKSFGAEDTLLDIFNSDQVLPDEGLLQESLKLRIRKAISVLSEQHREVIVLHYGLNGNPSMNLYEIAHYLDRTYERIRQLKERGLEILRSKASRGLMEFMLD